MMGSVVGLKKLTPILLSYCLLLLLYSTQSAHFKYCDIRDYAVKVHGVKISPDPVVIHKPATFKISASTGLLHS
ncbi:hypothetical protein PanWU01x14_220370 [Parasponia andersonii]|uniref:Cupredoxin n=1 Tax=Parasponia andersonii TaxID=3476 RepID=A0A2P5BQ54_PARAD|nr:hypothetical protein PanWU01x14_220370 [Parasponia andersonii]